MAKRTKKYPPIEIYVAKTQTGYNEYFKEIIATDGENHGGCEYKLYDPKSAINFHDFLVYSLAQKKGDVELHCRGNLRSISDEHRADGYFGRREYVIQREIFLRNLNPLERNYLQKQFDKLNRKTSLKLKLIN